MQNPNEFRMDIGDIDLSVVEWSGTGDPILLLHATGFHNRCWNEVVKHLSGRHVYAADLRFHGASGDTGETEWPLMANDIRLLIEKLNLHDVTGVGHSLGGHLIARAAAQVPERFKHLLLIDPVIMSPERTAHLQDISQKIAARDHPISRRKNEWRDAREMFERFKDRAPFNTWQPAVLRDYCDYALRPANKEELRQLACDPLNEAGIYVNHKGTEVIFGELEKITTPTTLLRAPPGDESEPSHTDSPTWPGLAAALPNCQEIYLPELNHFIPMQDPELVARHIIQATQKD
jgi:pimeloyl-ACP methyl ester carboxylesterase